MAEGYSVKAILSAQDKNFSSTFEKANKTAASFGSKLKSGLGFGVLMGIGQQAFNSIKNSASSLISELNESSAAWKTFQGNMAMFGKSKNEIAAVKKELQDYATKTIYSASEMASTYSQLEAVGTKNTTKLVKGFGGLAAAATNPKQAMKTLSVQATQMAAKPYVAWMDFKLMLEQTPAGLAAVAKQLGMTTGQLVKNVQAGKVKTEDFFDAIQKVGTNKSFTKLSTQYKTAEQALDGLKETLSVKLMPIFDKVSSVAISAIEKVVNSLEKTNVNSWLRDVQKFASTSLPYLKTLGSAFVGVGKAAFSVAGKIATVVAKFLSSKRVLAGFNAIVNVTKTILITFLNFLDQNMGVVEAVAPYVVALASAFKGFQILKTVTPLVGGFARSIGIMLTQGISGLTAKLTGLAGAQTATGTASGVSAPLILACAVAVVALGAGVALASAGIWLLADGATKIASAGLPAVGVLVAMTAAVAGLAVGAALLGPALTAGSIGFIAFGAAIALVGAGAFLAGSGLALIGAALPNIVNFALSGAAGVVALSGGLIALGAAGVVASAALIALAASSVAGTAGLVAFTAGAVVAGAGVGVLGVALKFVQSTLNSIARSAQETGNSLKTMVVSINIVKAGMDALGSKVKGILNSIINAFNNSNAKLLENSTRLGNSMSAGVTVGGSKAVAASAAIVSSLVATFRAGQPGVYAAGLFIGLGLAAGLNASAKQVRAASADLAGEAEKAIRAKAKIHSPSKISTLLGKFWGQGLVNGISNMINKVKQVAVRMISVLDVSTPQLAFAGGELSSDYSYFHQSKVSVEVPLYVNGKKFAHATAEDFDAENAKQEKIDNYLKGVR